MKKGQGLSITTIVVAAIALLVLVVLVAIFATQAGKTGAAVNSCETSGGECFTSDPGDTYTRLFTADCPNTGEVCYAKISNGALGDGAATE